MNCVVLAGGNPGPDDPLYVYSQGQPKALVRIGDKTILEYVLNALQEANNVEEIVVVGLDQQPGGLILKYPVKWVPDQGSLLSNGLAAVDWIGKNWPQSDHILFSSSDIPAITGLKVDRFVDSCKPYDRTIYYCFVTRESIESRFPGANRTYVRLGDLEVAGGDMIVSRPELARERQDLLEALIKGRKHPWKIARVVGLSTLIRLLLHQIDLSQVEQTATRIIGQPVKIFVSPDAEVAMDIDKLHQLELLRTDLTQGLNLAH